MTAVPRWVAIGKVTRTHGVRGCVKIFPYGESLERMKPGGEVYLNPAGHGSAVPLVIASIVRQKRMLVVGFRSMESVAQAQSIVGREITLPETLLPATDEDEYYHFQLLGLRVQTVQGRDLGILSSIFDTGPHDVYAVTNADGREALIPAVASVVLEVNLEDGYVLVDPPEGLIDDL